MVLYGMVCGVVYGMVYDINLDESEGKDKLNFFLVIYIYISFLLKVYNMLKHQLLS